MSRRGKKREDTPAAAATTVEMNDFIKEYDKKNIANVKEKFKTIETKYKMFEEKLYKCFRSKWFF